MDKAKNDSDNDMDDDVFGMFPDEAENGNTRVQRKYKQQYRKAWEKEPDFKGWLTSIPGQPTRAYCRACNRDLHAHRLTLLKHTISVKHMKAAVSYYESTVAGTKPNGGQSKLDKIELQVETNSSEEEEGSVLLVDETFPSKNAGDSKASKKGGVLESGEELTMQSVSTGIQPYPIRIPSNNDNRVNEESEDDPRPTVTTSELPQEPARSLVLARPDKPPISTHVLDTTRGLPVSGIQISLYQLIDGRWTHLNDSCTNPDGRCADLIQRESVRPGRYKMHFETHQYFELRGQDCLFPFVEVVFDIRSPAEYLHIPVLMTPYSYSVYRGS